MFLSLSAIQSSSSIKAMSKTVITEASYHAYTLWLFTYSDLKTMVIPSTAFAISNALAASQAPSGPRNRSDSTALLIRLPNTLFWAWINTLAFNINNQRQTNALEEDRLNKPWRPMPSGRLTRARARELALTAYPLAFIASIALGGGTTQCILLAFFGYLYNDLNGGDNSWPLRNVLNACGFTCFASGALEVALQSHIKSEMTPWLSMIGAVVYTTVHMQDMYDQPGDSAAGRRTIPLVFGDGLARWSIAIAVATWSWLCPVYWGSAGVGYLAPVALGAVVGLRSLLKRTIEDDKTTFKIYNAWLVSMYLLPLMKSYTVV